MNSLSPLGKISSGKNNYERDIMQEAINPLGRNDTNEILKLKRRATSDHLIDIPDNEKPKFRDDHYSPINKEKKLKSIKEMELDYLENGKDDGQAELALSGDSNVPQPSSSSSVRGSFRRMMIFITALFLILY